MFARLVSIALAALIFSSSSPAAEPAGDDHGILRFDPIVETMTPVTAAETKTGCVYSHFSERLNRRVWAIRQADGTFSHALGEGTTQPAPAMDIQHGRAERIEKLQQVNKELLLRLEREGGTAYFRLNKDDRWVLATLSTHSTIYDAETKRRWELLGGRYVPVSSGPFAYEWDVMDGRYEPLRVTFAGDVFAAGAASMPVVAMPDCHCGR